MSSHIEKKDQLLNDNQMVHDEKSTSFSKVGGALLQAQGRARESNAQAQQCKR